MTSQPSQADVVAYVQQLGLAVGSPELYQQVFVHRSYLNEHRTFALGHNERLEFLGDAVLELVVTEYLYRNHPNPEGELTNWRSALVKGEMLAQVAKEIAMEPHLLLSRGEHQSTGRARQLILANAFEALIGAIYLDQGYGAAQTFIGEHLITRLPKVLHERLYVDAKSDLQEKSQDQLGVTPTYVLLDASGPDHEKEFTVGVYIASKLIAQGSGRSKQKAEQAAAEAALQKSDEFLHQAL